MAVGVRSRARLRRRGSASTRRRPPTRASTRCWRRRPTWWKADPHAATGRLCEGV